MRQERIRRYASILMALLIVFTVYYQYRVWSGLLEFAFLEPERMERSWLSGGHVDLQMRWTWFAIWSMTIVAGLISCLCAIRLADLCRKGDYFSQNFANWMGWLGISTMTSMALDAFASSMAPLVLSRLNPEGQQGMSFHFNPQTWGLFLYGAGIYALAWIMREAITISEENDGFV